MLSRQIIELKGLSPHESAPKMHLSNSNCPVKEQLSWVEISTAIAPVTEFSQWRRDRRPAVTT